MSDGDDFYARVIYEALAMARLDCPAWGDLQEHRKERYRRAADKVETEMRRHAKRPSRVVAMRTRTVATEMEETGT